MLCLLVFKMLPPLLPELTLVVVLLLLVLASLQVATILVPSSMDPVIAVVNVIVITGDGVVGSILISTADNTDTDIPATVVAVRGAADLLLLLDPASISASQMTPLISQCSLAGHLLLFLHEHLASLVV